MQIKLNMPSDGQLLELIKKDDRNAFEIIYNKYWSKLYLSAYNPLRNRHLAEDIVQEVLVQLWTKRNDVMIESLSAYLYAAVRYSVFKAIRSGNVREGFFAKIGEIAINNTAEDKLHEMDVLKKLNEGIAKLPEKCQQIFSLSRKEHLSNKEIACRLGIAPKTVENQLTIAIRRIRTTMEQVLFTIILILIKTWL